MNKTPRYLNSSAWGSNSCPSWSGHSTPLWPQSLETWRCSNPSMIWFLLSFKADHFYLFVPCSSLLFTLSESPCPWWHTYSQLIDYSTAIIIRSAFVSLITRSSHQYCGKVASDFQVWYYQCFWNIMCHFTLSFILPLQAVGFIQQNRTEPRPH